MQEHDPEFTFLLRRYFHGGESAMPAIRKLMASGDPDYAAVVARLALRRAEGTDREGLLAVLAEITSAPTGWATALETFAAAPSEDAWEELMRFVPEEVFHQRLKYTVLVLIGLGCDGDVLFRCVSRMGMIPELFDLADSGSVDPETIVARATGSPAEGAWLGLAAKAAFARGDRAATARHLWRASQLDPILSYGAIDEIRRAADAELNAELERAGVGRGLGGFDDEDID
jgi:hypothetical protein